MAAERRDNLGMGSCQTRAYADGRMVESDFPLGAVSEHLAGGAVVWVDLCAPTRDELHHLADELGLHELAVEDALEPHQRSKLDVYPTHLFLACHAVSIDRATGSLVETEVDAFVNQHWLITVRKSDAFAISAVTARWDRMPTLAAHGVAYLLYGLLDVIVDDYFDAVEVFDEFYDTISETLFAESPQEPHEQRHWFEMRRALVRLHRLVVPLREAVSGLMRREHSSIPEAMYPYYQDLYDHIIRVIEATDALRDLIATIMETNLSLRDYRQNQVMKRITSWAAIIAVPTLVTGFYGMNVPYPGEGSDPGVLAAVLLILVPAGLLYVAFRNREWL